MKKPLCLTLTALVSSGCLIPAIAFADSTYVTLPLLQDWSNASAITVDDDWSGVPGILGMRGSDLVDPRGVDPQTVLASGGPVGVNANETDPNTFSTGGATEFAITNPVVALEGDGMADAPHLIFHVNATGLSEIRVSYVLRDIDASVDDVAAAVALQYRTTPSATWVNVPAGFVADASAGPSLTLSTPVTVVLPSGAENQATLQIRVITTKTQFGDEWIGVDDIEIRALPFTEVDSDPAPDAPSVAWGDYDSDGDLDYLLAGYTGSGAEVRLYRNEGGTTFGNGPVLDLGTTGAGYCKAAWGDYDNDNDLDLLTAYGTTRVWRNNGNQTFDDIGASLPPVSEPFLAWGDYDNDGDQDFLISGKDTTGAYLSQIRRNNGDATFDDIGAGLIGLSLGAADWGDFDNDGDLDLALVGSFGSGSNRVARVYRNDDGSAFVDIAAGLPGVRFACVEWGDYDADGDLDLALGGEVGAGPPTGVFRNDGSETFVHVASVTSPRGTASWGDYENDGDLDLLVIGPSAPGRVYRNDGTGFSALASFTTGVVTSGAAAWGDYDADGDLDILMAGLEPLGTRVTRYRNNTLDSNTPPGVPPGLSATATPTSATFSWIGATDSQTPTPGLSYNLRVGTLPNDTDIMSPMSAGTGYRRIAQLGNVNDNLAWTLDLPPGVYYWSVQSVDGAFEGSPFPAEMIVVVGGAFAETNILPTPNWAYSSVEWGDYDADGDLDLLLAGDFPVSAALSRGGGGAATVYRNDNGTAFSEVVPSLDLGNTGSGWLLATWVDYDSDSDLDILSSYGTTRVWRNSGGTFDDIGASLPAVLGPAFATGDYDNDGDPDFLITGTYTAPLTPISQVWRNHGDGTFDDIGASLVGVFNAAPDWGDFDGDGDLDILLAGSSDATPSSFVARVYRNDGGDQFADIAAGLTGLKFGASGEWGDYDADGDLDILLAGDTGPETATFVYRNDGSEAFTGVASLEGVSEGATAWGDYDNDGDLDILAAGSFSWAIRLFRNDGGAFSSVPTFPVSPFIDFVGAAWGDYDGDRDLDLMVAGVSGSSQEVFELYRNESTTPNTLPVSPAGLSATAIPTGATLSWLGATDSQTPVPGLAYNLRVGTSPGASNVLSPMSSSTGYRQVAQLGNVNGNLDWTLDVPPGTYYWTVQSIDGAFEGSPFAPEQSVSVGVVDATLLLSPPKVFALHAPRPTPFSRSAAIAFDLPRAAAVSLRVYDVGGRLVRTLADKPFPAGRHQVEWNGLNGDATPAANGVYFLALESRAFTAHHRLVLMR